MDRVPPHLASPTRRRVIATAAAATAVAAVGGGGLPQVARAVVPFTLPPLPYAEDALSPIISPTTIGFHYGKHHRGYVEAVNSLAIGAYAELPLRTIVITSASDPEQTALFNASAQAWNHEFYWNSMRPGGGGQPAGDLMRRIESDLGGWETFRGRFVQAAMGQFGSGWAWLAMTPGGVLDIVATANAETPLVRGWVPLITIDVWEHAYYLDYQNRRADYVKGWIDSLANWDFAAAMLADAKPY